MNSERIIDPIRVRTMEGSFAFIPHRFLRDGFWERLSAAQLVVYLFLVLVANRYGVSFYGKEKMRGLCKLIDGDKVEEILHALANKDLIARSDIYTQVLSLPQKPRGPVRRVVKERESVAGPVSVKEALAIYLRKDKKS